MMNKRIRSLIDELFAEMKMSAENLALRDELMANAQDRFEDAIAQGASEEEAFAQVASSLEDVHGLLMEMNRMDGKAKDAAASQPESQPETQSEQQGDAAPAIDVDRGNADEEKDEEKQEASSAQKKSGACEPVDLGDALNKAFDALGKWGQTIVPQTKKLVKEVDKATGGVIVGLGKSVNKGMKDAQKAAGEAIDRMSSMTGELVFDFGKKAGKADQAPEEKSPEQLLEKAKDLRAQAELKEVTGDQEGARDLRAQAYALETQAEAIEQAQAMADAQRAAEADVQADAQAEEMQPEASGEEGEEAPALQENASPLLDAEGDVNEDAFSRVVEQIQSDAKKILGDAQDMMDDAKSRLHEAVGGAAEADYTVTGERLQEERWVFPAAGLHEVDIQLDADDVRVESASGYEIEVAWAAQNIDGKPSVRMEGHKLVIRRENPDVFKTFFSVFSKNGGEIVVRVPHGHAAAYRVSTTSGDVYIGETDVDHVEIGTTSGDVRCEPDAAVRAQEIKVGSVSGDVTISACAGEVKGETVSGDLFISCDANRVVAKTVSGDAHVEGACQRWEADTVSGEVELLCTVAPTDKVDVNTVSGTVRVALPADIRGFVADLSGMSGKIVNEFGPNRYGTCALPIHMDTMSGSLVITRL